MKNHPDKGGDTQLFATVSDCADRMKFGPRPSTSNPATQPSPPEVPSESPSPAELPTESPSPPEVTAEEPTEDMPKPKELAGIPFPLEETSEPTPPPAEPSPSVEIPPTSIQDCRVPNIYFENTAGGDCLFEAFAQIYHPVDIRDKNATAYQQVLDTASKLRRRLAELYRRAESSAMLRVFFSIPQSFTDVDGRPMTISQYADHIEKPKTWATDTDLEVLSRLFKVPLHVIEHSPEGGAIMRDISGFGTNPSEDEYYNVCNIDNKHWVLKKHTTPRPLPAAFAKV